MESLKILSLSSVFPNPREAALGTFVRARLQQMARSGPLRVVAPVLQWDYRRLKGGQAEGPPIPRQRKDGLLEISHPRWIYPPGAGALTAILLFLELIWPVARLRKGFRFHVIDAHFGFPDGIAALFLSMTLRVPFTVTLRGSELLHARYPMRRLGMRWAVRRASRVIAVSRQLGHFAIELGASPDRVKTIPNGVDGDIFFPRDRNVLRAKLGLPQDLPVILTAGHLIELKGHHHVIRAVNRLRAAGSSVQLVIAGGAPARGVAGNEPQLRKLVADLNMSGSVRFLGHVPPHTLAEWMSVADVFCLASSREGCPNVVYESLACGTPVVATSVGGVTDMIPADEFGAVVAPDSPDALEAALGRALQTKWNRPMISAWARKRSWEQVAREVLVEMRQILNER